jgi:hypothetical protein
MEREEYQAIKALSEGVFKNGTILPVACAVGRIAADGDAFDATAVRRELNGHLESNQIREAFGRLEAAGAARQLPYPGRPHPRTWVRLASPVWSFLDEWLVHMAPPESAPLDDS